MQAYQQRVVDEKRDLDEKISKLGAFLNSPKAIEVDMAEGDRMIRQHEAMQVYSSILGERIQHFR